MPDYYEGMTAHDLRQLSPVDFTDGRLSVGTVHLACEMACHNILFPLFGEDDTSVGIRNDIWFWGNAAPGELLHAEAMISSIDGRRIRFNVFARAGIHEVARGVHERMLLSKRKFMAALPS